MRLLKRNLFVTSIVVMLLVCAFLFGLAIYVRELWLEKGMPLEDEEVRATFEEIGHYAKVITEIDAYESFYDVGQNDQGIIASNLADDDYLLDEEGNVIYESPAITLDADVVMIWQDDESFLTTLDELKKAGDFRKLECNYANASATGKYIIVTYGLPVDEKQQIAIVNRDFEKLYEVTKQNDFPKGTDITYEIDNIFFTETTEEDGWCYVTDQSWGYRYDVNIQTGEKTNWYEVPPEEEGIEYEGETYEGIPLWALNKRKIDLYEGYCRVSHTKFDRKALVDASWHRLHDLGLKAELEELLKRFNEVDVLGENFLAVYTYKGGTLVKLGEDSYE